MESESLRVKVQLRLLEWRKESSLRAEIGGAANADAGPGEPVKRRGYPRVDWTSIRLCKYADYREYNNEGYEYGYDIWLK